MTQAPMSELEPCPFCGGSPVGLGANRPYKYIKCENCRVSTGQYNTEQEAATAWNTRPSVEPSAGLEGMSADDIMALSLFKEKYPTWWWKIGWCDVTRDFDAAPQGHSPEIKFIKHHTDPWNEGFRCDHEGTFADAIYDVMAQIETMTAAEKGRG